MSKVALITGITGQDGSYLAELLLSKGYAVHGVVRRVASDSSEQRLWRLSGCLPQLTLHSGSLDSYPSLFRIVQRVQPTEVYHLAAQSFVSYSFEDEFSTLSTNVQGTHYVVSALREACPTARLYFASTSEMFGSVSETPQRESTPFHPRSPYGISKVTGFHMVRNYREAHNIFACSGILFNHESPRRGTEFVTRKITRAAARIKLGLQDKLKLGNLDARRDWGHAQDYVDAMWRMLQQDTPQDFVIASGRTHSVRDFCQAVFQHLGLDYRNYVEVDPALVRPADVMLLQGDASRAREALGWSPRISFEELVTSMVEADLELLRAPARVAR